MKLPDFSKIKSFFGNMKNKYSKLSDSQKKLTVAFTTLIVVSIAAIVILAATKSISSVHLECFESKETSSLIALDSNAQSGLIKNSEYANFKFSSHQKELFKKIYEENTTVSLTVRLELRPTASQAEILPLADNAVFRFGFLTSDDFTKGGRFIKQIYPDNRRILISGKENAAPKVFDISFAVQKNDNISKVIPEGFFVYSTVRCKVVAACVVPAEIGFDLTNAVPYYGFACTGGVVDFTNSSVDFSGASMVFPVTSSDKISMPELLINLYDNEEMKSGYERSVRAEMNIGGEKFYIKNVKAAKNVVIPTAAIKAPFSRLELLANKEAVSSVILRATHIAGKEVLDPVRTDPGLILNYKQQYWRTLDYEIFEWDRYPGILFFDTRNYDIQDNFFRRMAYFVEKAGYKGRLVSNEELEGKHGYNAHDYSAESMAKFFNEASRTNFQLLPEELLLKKILIHNGLLEVEADGVTVRANEGGLVSISQESTPSLRHTLLAHEGWHTIFFRDAEFRNYVSAVYYTMDPTSRDFLIDYFKSQPSLGYDTSDDYLMHNEFMAYLMQQKVSDTASYFVHHANRGTVIAYTPQLAAYIRKTEGKGFEDAAVALNEYVFDKYGIIAGNIALVSK